MQITPFSADRLYTFRAVNSSEESHLMELEVSVS